MGRRKGSKNTVKTTKGRKSRKQQKTVGTDLLGGVIAVLGLILFIFLKFDNASMGVIAGIIREIFIGLFGYADPFNRAPFPWDKKNDVLTMQIKQALQFQRLATTTFSRLLSMRPSRLTQLIQ